MAKRKKIAKRLSLFGKAARKRSAALVHRSPRPDAFATAQPEIRDGQGTDGNRAPSELETWRDRVALLYDSAPVSYLTLDARGIVREANQRAARLFGLPLRKLLGRRLARFVENGSEDDLHRHLHQAFASGAKQVCEIAMVRSDGTPFIGCLETVEEKKTDGDLPRCLMAVSDLTEDRKAQAELRESQARLAGIINSAMDAIVSFDAQRRVLLFNAAAEHMFGWSANAVRGKLLHLLIPARFHKLLDPEILARQPERNDFGHRERTCTIFGRRADGSVFPIEASLSWIDEAGKPISTIIMRDISRRIRSEDDLRRSEKNLADFFEQSPLGLLWVDAEGRILRVNRAQLTLLGCSQNECLNRPLAEFLVHPEAGNIALEHLAKREALRNFRVQLRCQDGSVRQVLIDANGLWERGRLVYSRWFVRDITQRLKLEEEILAISEREQRRFGHDLHDDLCQELAGIEYQSHTLAGELAEASSPGLARARKIAHLLRQAILHARQLAHDLSPVHLEAEGLKPALRKLASRTKQLFGVACHFSCDLAAPIEDDAVVIHLYRIAQEAVRNAVNHGKANRIDLGLTRAGSSIVLTVRDNGLGIPVKRRKSKGMGLRIMQYRAGVLGGSLLVQRRAKRGTSVVCTVRQARRKFQSPHTT